MALKFEPLSDDVSLEMQRCCQGAMPAGEVIHPPSGTVITEAYSSVAQEILDMEVRKDDIWVISFPKCGAKLWNSVPEELKKLATAIRTKTEAMAPNKPFLGCQQIF